MINETFALQFLDYCEDQQNLSTNTILAYRQDLKAFVTFQDGTENRGTSEQQSILRYGRCMLWREQVLLGPPSPFYGLELKFRKPKNVPRSIDAKTLQHLLSETFHEPSTATSFSQERIMHLMLKLLIVTGLRIGELTGLNIKDVFNHDRKIGVLGKGNKERIVYVANNRLFIEFKQFIIWRRQSDKLASHLFPKPLWGKINATGFQETTKTTV